tara:strand:+ start:2512 stop:2925 length:414 start_codon:yes stop_codon:yes gene_type:complete
MRLLNLCPHDVDLVVGGEPVKIPRSEYTARVKQTVNVNTFIDYEGHRIPVSSHEAHGVYVAHESGKKQDWSDFVNEHPDTAFIVSMIARVYIAEDIENVYTILGKKKGLVHANFLATNKNEQGLLDTLKKGGKVTLG